MKNSLNFIGRLIAVVFALLAIFTYFDHCARYVQTKDSMNSYLEQVDEFNKIEEDLIKDKEVLVSGLETAVAKVSAKKKKYKKAKEKLPITVKEPIAKTDTFSVIGCSVKHDVFIEALSEADSLIESQEVVIAKQGDLIAIQEAQIANRDTLLAIQNELIRTQENSLKKQARKNKVRKIANNVLFACLVGVGLVLAGK
jgi:DNA-binding protein H-NS